MEQTHTTSSTRSNGKRHDMRGRETVQSVPLAMYGGHAVDSRHASADTPSTNIIQREPPTLPAPAPPPQNRADAHPQPPLQMSSPNILVFGETGAGKSSILNMLAGSHIASVSPDAEGHTFSSTPYPITLPIPANDANPSTGENEDDNTNTPITLTFWDTAGLSEGEHGTVPAAQAMHHLQDLVGSLHARGGGISLLVFCIRAARFREIWKINYDLFAGLICQAQVPVILVVNGLENESTTMENWWIENSMELTKRNMVFSGHACITSTRGKKRKDGEYMYEEEYEESVRTLREVVGEHVLREPWIVDGERWLSEIAVKMGGYYGTSSGEGIPQPSVRPESVARDQRIPQAGTGDGRYVVHPVLSLVIEKFFDVVENLLTPARAPRRLGRSRRH